MAKNRKSSGGNTASNSQESTMAAESENLESTTITAADTATADQNASQETTTAEGAAAEAVNTSAQDTAADEAASTAETSTAETATVETATKTEQVTEEVKAAETTDPLAAPAVTSGIGRAVLAAIEEYETVMKVGRPVKELDGARHQRAFATAILQLINDTTDEDFDLLFTWLLARFAAFSSGIYSHDYVFRFIQNVALSKELRESYMRVVNLLRVTAASETRALAVKQINFKLLFDGATITARGQTRIQTFYNL